MENEFFFPPPKTSEFSPWLENFVSVLLPIYADFDITQVEMDELVLDNASFVFVVKKQSTYENTYSEFLNTRNIIWYGDSNNPNLALVPVPEQPAISTPVPAPVRPQLYNRLKSLVLRLRQHPRMTEVTAKNLGILPVPKSSDSPNDYLPVLKGSVMNGQAVLDCPIKEFYGYEIWRAVGSSNEYVFFNKSVGRSFVDETPIPTELSAELRSYRVRMLDSNNQPVGQWSNIVQLTVSRVV